MNAVPFDELASLAGVSKPAALRRYLDEKGIKYYLDRKGRPWTTPNALDAPLIGRKKQKQIEPNFGHLAKKR